MKFFTPEIKKPFQAGLVRPKVAVKSSVLWSVAPLLLVSSAAWASGDKGTQPATTPTPAPPSKSTSAKTSRKHSVSRSHGKSAARNAKTVTSGRSTAAIVQAVKTPVAPLLRPIPPYQKTMPGGSYLVKPARLDNAAYQQAITRPMILQRYQYAWKTTPAETLRRLRGLRLTRLAEPGVYRVYYTRANGAWGYKVRSVPAGTLVFTLPNTPRPLMLQVCGNPVEEVLPPHNAKNKGMVPPFSPHEADSGLVLEDVGDTGDLYAFSPQTPDFLGSGETLSGNSGNLMPIPPVIADSLDSSGGALFPIPLGSGGLNAGNLILPIVGTAIGSQIINTGGGNGGGNNAPANGGNGGTNGTNGVTPVPEAGGGVFGGAIVAAMGLALAWPALSKRRNKA